MRHHVDEVLEFVGDAEVPKRRRKHQSDGGMETPHQLRIELHADACDPVELADPIDALEGNRRVERKVQVIQFALT